MHEQGMSALNYAWTSCACIKLCMSKAWIFCPQNHFGKIIIIGLNCQTLSSWLLRFHIPQLCVRIIFEKLVTFWLTLWLLCLSLQYFELHVWHTNLSSQIIVCFSYCFIHLPCIHSAPHFRLDTQRVWTNIFF